MSSERRDAFEARAAIPAFGFADARNPITGYTAAAASQVVHCTT